MTVIKTQAINCFLCSMHRLQGALPCRSGSNELEQSVPHGDQPLSSSLLIVARARIPNKA
jgi:hypothetical protein